MVRVNNQLDYWLFKKVHANNVVVGRDNYLYERAYIEEYCGMDFVGEARLRKEILMVKKIQDTLEHLGKTFVFLYAPSKAHYYSEMTPDYYRNLNHTHETNYKVVKRLCDSIGINQIDFNGWFMSIKDNSKNLLFSRQGTHWTVYGSLIAADSFIKYLEIKRHEKLPELHWKEIEFSNKPRRSDDDILAALNLIFEYKNDIFSYPKYYYDTDSTRSRPTAIYIGDSFIRRWAEDDLMHNIHKDWDFWYYFQERWNEKSVYWDVSSGSMQGYDWKSALLKTDCLIFMDNPENFKGLGDELSCFKQIYDFLYPTRI